ncbi:phosphatase PAP2 family protein [uncultured Bacteroides sp.]|uniref:phosphatase PAP2 family protein n=1 Tax=uncultured Bacteroides sp. TaxID=162156 RepID=UPI002AA8E4CD|nr:phosphatase PAP2 family protein [uncultured Bacteroides sp.]
MIEYLNSLDTRLFLFLNCKHDAFFDFVMYWLSDKLIWIPMYFIIAFFIVKRYRIKGLVMLLLVALLITLCDQTASHLLKNLVQRLRPSHEPALAGLVHLSRAGAGGLYGFVSSHAANTFGLATFLWFVLDKKFIILKYWLFIWAALVSYSRIYNGVHYFGDVFVAAFLGAFFGWAVSKIYFYYEIKCARRRVLLPASAQPIRFSPFPWWHLWKYLVK